MESPVEQYRLLIENFPDGIVFLFEGRDPPEYTLVGGEGLERIGLTKAKLEGNPVANNRPPDIQAEVRSQYRRVLDGEQISFVTEVEARSFRIRGTPVTDEEGTVIAGMGLAEDVTERLAYQRQLERQNDRLEAVSELLSHDIQNPLNIALGRLDVLRAECDSDHLDPLEDALERIEALTNSELKYAHELSDEDLTTLELREAAETAWTNVETAAATLVVEDERSFRADERQLRRLFENLYRNAVEHGGEDVTVRVGTVADGFYVEDDGVGVPSSERENLFERGVTHAIDGTGLGLYIVGSVAEDHGWSTVVSESDEGGARFVIGDVDFV